MVEWVKMKLNHIHSIPIPHLYQCIFAQQLSPVVIDRRRKQGVLLFRDRARREIWVRDCLRKELAVIERKYSIELLFHLLSTLFVWHNVKSKVSMVINQYIQENPQYFIWFNAISSFQRKLSWIAIQFPWFNSFTSLLPSIFAHSVQLAIEHRSLYLYISLSSLSMLPLQSSTA